MIPLIMLDISSFEVEIVANNRKLSATRISCKYTQFLNYYAKTKEM